MHETLHSDVIGTDAISSNELCRYLKLVLWRAAGAKVERAELVRKAVQPVSNLFRKRRDRQRVIFQHDHPTGLVASPFQCTAVIPVGTPVVLVHQQVSAKRVSQPFGLLSPGVMTHNNEPDFTHD
ncbi:hypothetical protein ABIC80_000652 [Kosakonia sp. 1610]